LLNMLDARKVSLIF